MREAMSERIGLRTIGALNSAANLVNELREKRLFICTVESCTGGGLANAITSIPGASEVLRDSFVTYSNQAKIALGVSRQTIDRYTVYSTETAIAMARAGMKRSVRADVGVGITGSLTRRDPDNPNSIPGQVFIGVVTRDREMIRTFIIPEEDRSIAKLQIVKYAIDLIIELIEEHTSIK